MTSLETPVADVDPLDALTLPDFARLILGVDYTQIFNDLARLGYISINGKKKKINFGHHELFRYVTYEDGWQATIRPTEAGRERIMQHYLNGELTLNRPYKKYTSPWGDEHFCFNASGVAYHAELARDQLSADQERTLDDVIALNGRTPKDEALNVRVHDLGMYLRTINVIRD